MDNGFTATLPNITTPWFRVQDRTSSVAYQDQQSSPTFTRRCARRQQIFAWSRFRSAPHCRHHRSKLLGTFRQVSSHFGVLQGFSWVLPPSHFIFCIILEPRHASASNFAHPPIPFGISDDISTHISQAGTKHSLSGPGSVNDKSNKRWKQIEALHSTIRNLFLSTCMTSLHIAIYRPCLRQGVTKTCCRPWRTCCDDLVGIKRFSWPNLLVVR